MPFLTYSAMVRLREVVICSDASVPTARFKDTPLSALPKPIEGAKAPTNQIAQKAHTLTSSENSQKSLYKSSKQTKRLTQKREFLTKSRKSREKSRKRSLSIQKPSNSSKLKPKSSADKVIADCLKNIIIPDFSKSTTRVKLEQYSELKSKLLLRYYT